MASTEERIQATIHSLELGRLAVWVRRVAAIVVAIGLACFYLFTEFSGLATSQAMDQAQIARSLLAGEGWKTQFVRPLVVGELEKKGKEVKSGIWRDTYHPPLPTLVNALALWPVKGHLEVTTRTMVATGDMAIAAMAMLLFFGALGVIYLIAVQLFDRQVAWFGCGLMLVCEMMWRYTLSGLPQMLMLLLFSATFLALIRAMRAQYLNGPVFGWVAAAGAGFGLLAMTHGITAWIFAPALVFCACWFRARARVTLLLLGVFLAVCLPWWMRNYSVCGHPFGVARFAVFDGILGPEMSHMRKFDPGFALSPDLLLPKVRAQLTGQFERIFGFLGWSIIAPLGFVSWLHRFRRPVTASARLLVFAMWIGAVAGMLVYGLREEQGVAANQLHLLFVPLFTCFGVAYLFVQWNQQAGLAFALAAWNERARRWARNGLIVAVFALCALPLLLVLRATPKYWKVRWPPYLPSYISVLGQWMGPDELIATDMPWAVAWYANRPALWIPHAQKEVSKLHDFNVLGMPINGLYFTPISGTQNTLGDLLQGDYMQWAPLIVRQSLPKEMHFRWAVVYGAPDCIFIADRDRKRFR